MDSIFDTSDFFYEGPREECGVFGVFDYKAKDAANIIYYGLMALQHRGQESCGIAVTDRDGAKGKVLSHKGMGLVHEVFDSESLEKLAGGNIGVGHVRYSTTGSSSRENAQPLVLNYVKGMLALAHNGNLINALKLREELAYSGAIFQTSIDSEVIAYHIARERVKTKTVEEAAGKACQKIKGAYSMVIMSPRKLIGVRDPHGFRPLCIGKRGGAWIIASETAALDTVGAEFVRDVEPGEIVTITKDGIKSDKLLQIPENERTACIFEYIYFSRLDSRIDGISVFHSRMEAGKCLAEKLDIEADLVVPVPDSGNGAALGYALASGIPYGNAFVKNSYVGRTFIQPGQENRESAVRVKLNVLKDGVNGKRIIMIDDSIVRGTTSKRIVQMLRDAGAKEVHLAISAPPFRYPCYFGTDIPDSEQLIAWNKSIEKVKDFIGADSLTYLDVEDLYKMVGKRSICTACFTGKYPIEPPDENIRGEYDR